MTLWLGIVVIIIVVGLSLYMVQNRRGTENITTSATEERGTLTSSVTIAVAHNKETCLKELKIAIYNGPKTWFSGLEALKLYLKSRNISYEIINSTTIKDGGLKNFNVLIVPGGWAYSYWLDLGEKGNNEIRAFVKNGGGYLGICAGAFYASQAIIWESGIYHYSLKIIDAVAEGPKKGYPWPTQAYITINVTRYGRSLGLNATYRVLYYGGPEFLYLGKNITVLAVYSDDRMPAIVLSSYGKGRVALTGVHLEILESSWPILDDLLSYLGDCR